MKKRILLVDESLTVQKVVALTLDRQRYQIHYAKTRPECIKQITENLPDLILISDQVSDLNIPSFPKEMENWLGRQEGLPPVVLITGQEIKEVRNYAAVLRKPFSPQGLQSIVTRFAHVNDAPHGSEAASPPLEDEFEDQRLQKIFNDTFNDEASLVKETYQDEEATQFDYVPMAQAGQEAWDRQSQSAAGGRVVATPAESFGMASPEPAAAVAPVSIRQSAASDLWGAPPPPAPKPSARPKPAATNQNPGILSAEDSMAYKAVLESKVEDRLQSGDLDEIVSKLLDKLVPPIVERLVQERLDQLLKDQDQFLEIKQD